MHYATVLLKLVLCSELKTGGLHGVDWVDMPEVFSVICANPVRFYGERDSVASVR